VGEGIFFLLSHTQIVYWLVVLLRFFSDIVNFFPARRCYILVEVVRNFIYIKKQQEKEFLFQVLTCRGSLRRFGDDKSTL
jgi:hypothetical protein